MDRMLWLQLYLILLADVFLGSQGKFQPGYFYVKHKICHFEKQAIFKFEAFLKFLAKFLSINHNVLFFLDRNILINNKD